MPRRTRLIERREALGRTQADVAARAHCAVGSYARYEAGTSTPRPGDRLALAEALDWDLAQLAVALSDGLPAVNGHAVPGWLGMLASFEQASGWLGAYEATTIHGLLQTVDYATAVESLGPERARPAEVARRVASRLARQAVLDRDPDPLVLQVILDESVLHRVAGSRETMAAQLEHLVDLGDRPNIDLRVLPFAAGMFPFGSLTLLTQLGASEPWVAITEDLSGPHVFERDTQAEAHDRHLRLFEYLTDLALHPDDSAELIAAIAKEYRQ